MISSILPPTARLDSQFVPRESHGTNLFENTNTPSYALDFTDATLASNPFPNFQGAS